jgi:hypothetical protein
LGMMCKSMIKYDYNDEMMMLINFSMKIRENNQFAELLCFIFIISLAIYAQYFMISSKDLGFFLNGFIKGSSILTLTIDFPL